MAKITRVWGEVIHDSRGDDTIQVSVETNLGAVTSAAMPAGASKSRYEAIAVEPKKSLELIAGALQPLLVGRDLEDQQGVDRILIEADGTANKSRLGGNTILGISLAVSRAAAHALGLPLYQYIGRLADRQAYSLPVPMMNLINGGVHADNNLDIQEFMVVPDGVDEFHNQLSAGKLIFSTLGQQLRGTAAYIPVGDEGGYAPDLDTNEMACGLLQTAIKNSGYELRDEVSLALDVAASKLPATFEATTEHYLSMLKEFAIFSIEDPFDEESWDKWAELKEKMESTNTSLKKMMLVGDDLFATNLERLQKGISTKATNAILVKLNQIGSLSETLTVVEEARLAGYFMIVSHRSGETLDDYIADFAVGIGAQFIKTGAPNESHPERMSKYRRLLKIERELRG